MTLATSTIPIASASAVLKAFPRSFANDISGPTSSDVADPSGPNQQTQDVFQKIVKGRKSWKTLRGVTEAVWPPPLEAALIQGSRDRFSHDKEAKVDLLHFLGLENYRPDDSRETRLLGRFPMRNKFISDYIFQVTGKRRTAKQVGSRLQQLRDSCGGNRCKSPTSAVTFEEHLLICKYCQYHRSCRSPKKTIVEHRDGHRLSGSTQHFRPILIIRRGAGAFAHRVAVLHPLAHLLLPWTVLCRLL